jgi:16S rRNA (cytosine967-C5)-methyltransferase
MLAAQAVDARPGMQILDCCAAPGGKTIQAAVAVGPKGHVIALDNSEARLERLRENLERTGLAGNVEVALCDAASPGLVRRFAGRRIDAVLVDAPCSNSGVLARRPDARWRWSADEVERLSAVQLSILRNVARLGAGRIVYSTCSIDRAENEGVVSAFTEKAACGYVVEKSRTWLPIADLPDFDRFLPPTWHDGAFAALLRRV